MVSRRLVTVDLVTPVDSLMMVQVVVVAVVVVAIMVVIMDHLVVYVIAVFASLLLLIAQWPHKHTMIIAPG
jgi:ABC-type bacteriocin/lantibiotic exporter with double-glycine peptidase domain